MEQTHGRSEDVSYRNLGGKHSREKEQLRKTPYGKGLLDVIKKFCVVGVELGRGSKEKR